MQRARTVDEYVEWVRDAMFEITDLRACMEYELEDLSRFPDWLESLEKAIKSVYQSMESGDYVFGREDLALYVIAKKYAPEIPFMSLLERINATHLHGLDVDDAS